MTHTSQQLQAEFGIIRKNNCLIWKKGGILLCGITVTFVCAQRLAHDNVPFLFCIVRFYERLGDGWWHDQGRHMCVDATTIDFTVAFGESECKTKIRPLIPDL